MTGEHEAGTGAYFIRTLPTGRLVMVQVPEVESGRNLEGEMVLQEHGIKPMFQRFYGIFLFVCVHPVDGLNNGFGRDRLLLPPQAAQQIPLLPGDLILLARPGEHPSAAWAVRPDRSRASFSPAFVEGSCGLADFPGDRLPERGVILQLKSGKT